MSWQLDFEDDPDSEEEEDNSSEADSDSDSSDLFEDAVEKLSISA